MPHGRHAAQVDAAVKEGAGVQAVRQRLPRRALTAVQRRHQLQRRLHLCHTDARLGRLRRVIAEPLVQQPARVTGQARARGGAVAVLHGEHEVALRRQLRALPRVAAAAGEAGRCSSIVHSVLGPAAPPRSTQRRQRWSLTGSAWLPGRVRRRRWAAPAAHRAPAAPPGAGPGAAGCPTLRPSWQRPGRRGERGGPSGAGHQCGQALWGSWQGSAESGRLSRCLAGVPCSAGCAHLLGQAHAAAVDAEEEELPRREESRGGSTAGGACSSPCGPLAFPVPHAAPGPAPPRRGRPQRTSAAPRAYSGCGICGTPTGRSRSRSCHHGGCGAADSLSSEGAG